MFIVQTSLWTRRRQPAYRAAENRVKTKTLANRLLARGKFCWTGCARLDQRRVTLVRRDSICIAEPPAAGFNVGDQPLDLSGVLLTLFRVSNLLVDQSRLFSEKRDLLGQCAMGAIWHLAAHLRRGVLEAVRATDDLISGYFGEVNVARLSAYMACSRRVRIHGVTPFYFIQLVATAPAFTSRW